MSRGIARKGFDLDLRDGQAREDAFSALLADWPHIEHKRDETGERTGNVAIEYETSTRPHGGGTKRPSGIATTESKWWCVEYLEDHRLFLPTATVKALARAAIPLGLHRWVGDNDRFHCALVPRAWFVDVLRIWTARPELKPPAEDAQLEFRSLPLLGEVA
jgi:hypothetical protein